MIHISIQMAGIIRIRDSLSIKSCNDLHQPNRAETHFYENSDSIPQSKNVNPSHLCVFNANHQSLNYSLIGVCMWKI